MFVLGFIALLGIGVVLSLIEIALIECDKYGWSVTVALVSIVSSYYLIDGVAAWVQTVGWENLAIHAAVFLGVGVGVAFLKWIRFVAKFSSGLAAFKEDFVVRQPKQLGASGFASQGAFEAVPFDKANPEHLTAFYDKVKTDSGACYSQIRAGLAALPKKPKTAIETMDHLVTALTPRALNATDRIASWIFTWPFVVAHTIMADILVKLGKHAARLFDAVFGRVAKAIVANGLK